MCATHSYIVNNQISLRFIRLTFQIGHSSSSCSGRSCSARSMSCRLPSRLLQHFWGHVCFGRPTFRFSCGFQSRACLVTLETGFRSVWPIHPHFLFLMSISIGACLVLSHSWSLETTFGHLILRIYLRPWC